MSSSAFMLATAGKAGLLSSGARRDSVAVAVAVVLRSTGRRIWGGTDVSAVGSDTCSSQTAVGGGTIAGAVVLAGALVFAGAVPVAGRPAAASQRRACSSVMAGRGR